MRIALVTRAPGPGSGADIGAYVGAMGGLLAREAHAEVTIFVLGGAEVDPTDVVVPEGPSALGPGPRIARVLDATAAEAEGFCCHAHAGSARAYLALREHFGEEGPDLVEFADFLGDAAVTVQARRAGLLRHSRVIVRLHASWEMRSVLNGRLGTSDEERAICSLERYALRFADTIVYASDEIRSTYERFYGPAVLARAGIRIRHAGPAGRLAPASASTPPPTDEPMRLLALGPLDRRSGVADLVRAATALGTQLEVTLLGADTPTAPLGTSMQDQLDLMAAGSASVSIGAPAAPDELPDVIDRHHAVVVPARWDAWPGMALNALARNRPVLATPVGGLGELTGATPGGAGPGGLLAAGTGEHAVRTLLMRVVADPELVFAPVRSGRPRRHYVELTDPAPIAEAYQRLARHRPVRRHARRAAGRGVPTVTVVLPYFQMDRYLGEALASVRAQTHPALEIVIVNDGSFREVDRVAYELAEEHGARIVSKVNAGLGGARMTGIAVARGRYILPLDPDNTIEPDFVARAVAALEDDATLAYVSAWLRFIDEDGTPHGGTYQPISNHLEFNAISNMSGDAVAVLPRSVFDAGIRYDSDLAASFEDWVLYRVMAARGMVGHVIPEHLINYRIRGDSMLRAIGTPNEAELLREREAAVAESRVRWTL